MNTRILIGLIIVCTRLMVVAQQDPKTNHFFDVKMWYNPAYAGFDSDMKVSFLHRSQWINHNGSPHTQIASWDMLAQKNVGLGAHVVNDRIGKTNRTDAVFNLAYQIPLGEYVEDGQFSFGMRGGTSFIMLDELAVNEAGDERFQDYNQTHFIPKIGVGMAFERSGFEVGIALADLFSYDAQKLYITSEDGLTGTNRNINVVASYDYYTPDEKWMIQPNVLFKSYAQLREFVLNTNVVYSDQYMAGLSFSNNSMLSALFSFRLESGWKIGYSGELYSLIEYDTNTSAHELFIQYQINKHKNGRPVKARNDHDW